MRRVSLNLQERAINHAIRTVLWFLPNTSLQVNFLNWCFWRSFLMHTLVLFSPSILNILKIIKLLSMKMLCRSYIWWKYNAKIMTMKVHAVDLSIGPKCCEKNIENNLDQHIIFFCFQYNIIMHYYALFIFILRSCNCFDFVFLKHTIITSN